MAVISQAVLDALRTTIVTKFEQAYKTAPIFWDKIAMREASASKSNTYGWPDVLPKMREWLGSRAYHDVKERQITINNKDFELSFEIDANDIEDDNLGIRAKNIAMQGRAAAKHWDYLLRDLIEAADATTGFDGQFFFDTDHPIDINNPGLGTQSNRFTSSALSSANFNTVLTAMQEMKGADNEPIGAFQDLSQVILMVPPQLRKTAREIVKVETISAGGENPQAGDAQILVVPELTSSTKWFLIDASMDIMPFGIQVRKEPEVTQLTSATNDVVFDQRKFRYGVHARGDAFLGLYFLAAQADE